MSFRILVGDCRDSLKSLADQSVQCCVTSPPYYGLRDYGHAAQLGLEKTPAEYVEKMVEVFREVRRVLRDDGTLWLNIGDSYNTAGTRHGDAKVVGVDIPNAHRIVGSGYKAKLDGMKNKDLIGIPWALATALRDPYYTGEIKSERDRVWLAATIDAEGCISGYRHERKDDGRIRTGVNVTITNTSELLLGNAARIWTASRHDHMSGERLGSRPVYRWISTGVDRNAMLMRELYPYLIVKQRQALLAYNLFELSRVAKRDGQTLEGANSRAKRDALVTAISRLNQGEDTDIPSWCVEPPSPTEPGWYLRSDIIWAKPNPMPESVTDRPTKSHEYLFLLSKSATYYYDSEAIAETASQPIGVPRLTGQHKADAGGFTTNGHGPSSLGSNQGAASRNRRSVWTIATRSFAEAHFATFPPKLIEPCILAGSKKGDTVLDPFGGAGTTGLVADRLGRDSILCELNEQYAEMARKRITDDSPLFAERLGA